MHRLHQRQIGLHVDLALSSGSQTPNPRLSGPRGQMRFESTVNVYSAITYGRGYLTLVPLVAPYVYETDTNVSACLATICSTSSAEDEDQGDL